MKHYYFLNLVIVLLCLACSCQEKPKKKSLVTQKGAVVISNTAHLKNFLQIKNARFLESNKEEFIPYNLPQKVIRWSDSYLYLTLEQYQAKSKLLLFDQNWSNVQGVIEPTTGGPDSVREITDFFCVG